jgi:hypothetical protein
VADIFLTRTLHGLAASDDESKEVLRQWKVGDTIRAKVSKMRNAQHHRKFFAMLSVVWMACEKYPSVESLLTDLKFRLGHTEDVVLVSSGEVVRIPRSISFAAMDQMQFHDFYERALRELCEMAGGIEYDSLRQTVLEQLQAA